MLNESMMFFILKTSLGYLVKAVGTMRKRALPSSPAENVQYFYDDVALGNKGVGRLTWVIDASGESAFSYDPRGNVVREARTPSNVTSSPASRAPAPSRRTSSLPIWPNSGPLKANRPPHAQARSCRPPIRPVAG